MELEERLSYLENVRDWPSLVEELEKGIESSSSGPSNAQFHLKLGRVLETKFLAGVKALKHFQDAYKLNPALVESLEAARNVYWDLAKLNMVQKLLELELKAVADGPQAGELLLELGDVLSDQGELEKSAAAYARGLGASGGKSAEARACLEDVQLQPSTWQEHLAGLQRSANKEADPAKKSRLFLRARAGRAALRPPRGRGDACNARTRRSRPIARWRRSTKACSRSMGTWTCSNRSSSRRSPRSRTIRRGHGSRYSSGRDGRSATRTSTSAPACSKRPSSSTGTTRAPSISSARPTARRAATGTAC